MMNGLILCAKVSVFSVPRGQERGGLSHMVSFPDFWHIA